MLILRRKKNEWTEITGKDGLMLKIKVVSVRQFRGTKDDGEVEIAFLDDDHNYLINRPERIVRGPKVKTDEAV